MADIVFDPAVYSALYSCFNEYNCTLMRLLRTLLASPVSNILDLACGIGLSTNALQVAFTNSNIMGIDQSESMIAHAINISSDAKISFGAQDAATFLRTWDGPPFDMIFIKSAYHLLEPEIRLKDLTKILETSGVIVIAERTERSARSYPLFPAASHHWSNYFSAARQTHRLEAARNEHLHVRFVSYGEYVEVPSDSYLDAIRAGQLSFLRPFQVEMIESWCATNPLCDAPTVLLVEEFVAYLHSFNKTILGTVQR
jgi:trans-aconitate methyltransferase